MTVEGVLYRYSARYAQRRFWCGAGIAAIATSLIFGFLSLPSETLLLYAASIGLGGIVSVMSVAEPLLISLDDMCDIEEACDMTPELLGRLQAHCAGGPLTYSACVRALREAEPKRAPLKLPRKRIHRLMHVPGRSL